LTDLKVLLFFHFVNGLFCNPRRDGCFGNNNRCLSWLQKLVNESLELCALFLQLLGQFIMWFNHYCYDWNSLSFLFLDLDDIILLVYHIQAIQICIGELLYHLLVLIELLRFQYFWLLYLHGLGLEDLFFSLGVNSVQGGGE